MSKDFRTGRFAAARVRLALAATTIVAASIVAAQGASRTDAQTPVERPNILWITSEDNGPQIGAYGDAYATTPNLDALAERGVRYSTAWSTGPVCGASRTALITGVYPAATGGEHMRSMVDLPEHIRLYPALLREAGYYTTNNSKTDYNYPEVGQVWDESSNTAHWKNRPEGRPFFSVFNITLTHEGQVRTRPHDWQHDVESAPVPGFMPNTRETREDWAQYYDNMTAMDAVVGERLRELEEAGLADDTIVMYFGDHGPGFPRSKRFPYNVSFRVPLIIHIPEKFRHLAPPDAATPGSVSDRLVSFIDLPPTLLSLAGVQPPEWMHGRAFLGRYVAPAPEYLYGFRGRADERYDFARTVRDARYVYIRNYMPHRPHGQHVSYLFQTPSTAVWKRLYDEGRLPPEHASFFEPKPSEELYDLQEDPFEIRNLAGSPEHRQTLLRMRAALEAHQRELRDVGFMPEYELHRDTDVTVYERRLDPARYDFDRIYQAAWAATDRSVDYANVRPGLTDANPIVRYWAATGALVRGRDAVASAVKELEALLEDPEPGPRIVAAEALGRFGPAGFRDRAIQVLLRASDPAAWGTFNAAAALHAAQFALYTLNQFEGLSQEVKDAVAKLPPVSTGRRGGRGAGAAAGVQGSVPAGVQSGPPAASLQRGDYRTNLKAAIAADVR